MTRDVQVLSKATEQKLDLTVEEILEKHGFNKTVS